MSRTKTGTQAATALVNCDTYNSGNTKVVDDNGTFRLKLFGNEIARRLPDGTVEVSPRTDVTGGVATTTTKDRLRGVFLALGEKVGTSTSYNTTYFGWGGTKVEWKDGHKFIPVKELSKKLEAMKE
jgi:hypothetical protein